MPELPEVETIRLGLEKHLSGLMLGEIEIRLPRIFSGEKEKILGQKILGVRRFGKGLVIDFANEYALAIHVKMTGQLVLKNITNAKENKKSTQDKLNNLPNKYTHVIFTFINSKTVEKMYYNDVRQFGWIKALPKEQLIKQTFFKTLGKEPLKDLSLTAFKHILSLSKAPIKQMLMEQRRIAGIGNIYANDALWDSRIHPLQPSNSLTDSEIQSLFTSLEKILRFSLSLGGASERDYVNALGEKGGYQNHFLVYKQTGKPCGRCKTLIERIVVGGRGTFICPACQQRS